MNFYDFIIFFVNFQKILININIGKIAHKVYMKLIKKYITMFAVWMYNKISLSLRSYIKFKLTEYLMMLI